MFAEKMRSIWNKLTRKSRRSRATEHNKSTRKPEEPSNSQATKNQTDSARHSPANPAQATVDSSATAKKVTNEVAGPDLTSDISSTSSNLIPHTTNDASFSFRHRDTDPHHTLSSDHATYPTNTGSEDGEKHLSSESSQDPNVSHPSSGTNGPVHRRLQQTLNKSPAIDLQPPTRAQTYAENTQEANANSPFQQQDDNFQLARLAIPDKGKRPFRSRSSSSPRRREPAPTIVEGVMTGPIFPKSIPLRVFFTFHEEGVRDDLKPYRDEEHFDWTEPDNYQALIPDTIVDEVRNLHRLEKEHIYPRHGSCRVKGQPGLHFEGHYSILDDMEVLSQKSIINICSFISRHPTQPFSLEVYWDFGSAQLEPVKGRPYAETIQMELDNKRKTNFLGSWYIPRRDLDVFLVMEVVTRVVEEDHSLTTGEKKGFVGLVQDFAVKLFIICVYLKLNMKFLRHLIDDHRCSDDPSNHPTWNTGINCDDMCKFNIKKVVEALPMFFVLDVKRNFQHRDLKDDDVLPLIHTGPKLESGRKKMCRLGEDEGVNKVYKVTIDPSHHYVSPNPDCEFAVKEFSQIESFNCEKMMLKEFANFPDDHIVLHIMTWSQLGVHYILSDKAKNSLRTFINDTDRFDELTKPVVIWFLRQLKGLANAIKHVHHFSKRTWIDTEEEEADDYWGRHNDIKPENILVFQKDEHQHPVFKITDFGQGIFKDAKGKLASEKDSRAVGTRAYWAPETVKESMSATNSRKAKEGKVSRPIDMWALGCVFLELLLWLFGFYQDDNEDGFSTARESFPGCETDNRDDMFWFGDRKRRMLRPAVEKVLGELKNDHCKNMRAFQRVIEAIEKLLEINPSERMKAKELAEWMSQVVRQTESDLAKNQNYYQEQYRKNRFGSEVGKGLLSERLNPDYSPSMSRAPSSSSSRETPPLRDAQALLHSDSAPPELLHTGSAMISNDVVQHQPRQLKATVHHNINGDYDGLQKELDDLGLEAGPSNL